MTPIPKSASLCLPPWPPAVLCSLTFQGANERDRGKWLHNLVAGLLFPDLLRATGQGLQCFLSVSLQM